ncbi:hypothetical protein PENTCL1PPCAC_505, partial [Pristionchus entomophagus]
DADSTAALKARIAQLESEMKEVKSENSLLKLKVHAGEPICQKEPLHTHDFKVEMKPDVTDIRSETHVVDGVEFSVRLEKHSKREGGGYARDAKFSASLYVKNIDSDKQKFILTTIEVREKERYCSTPRYSTLLKPATQRFVLCCGTTAEEEPGYRKSFQSTADQSTYMFYVRITVAVQAIDSMDLDDGPATTVVVKNKEFLVSSQYLSLWSHYFKAYFRADMKEKKAGRYPIKDKDITPEDFEELLMVIYPTDKPITVHNYRRLLKLASRFEMPELTRRIECFLIDFERNELDRAVIFRLATDLFPLNLVQSTLLHRWRDSTLLQNELLKSGEYEKLKVETKAMVNARFAQACIAKDGGSATTPTASDNGEFNSSGDDEEDNEFDDEEEDMDNYYADSDDPY